MRTRSLLAVRGGRRRHVPWYCRKFRTMTKKNIVRRITDELDRTELETKLIVQKTLDAMITSWPTKAASNSATSACSL